MAVFDIAEALANKQTTVAPVMYASVNAGAIRSLSVFQNPSLDSEANILHDAEPTIVLTAGYDGSHNLVDLRDISAAQTAVHERSALSYCLRALAVADSYCA